MEPKARDAPRLRNSLLVAEVALTFTLSVTAILLTRQLIRQSRQDLGFSAENLITLDSHAVSTTPPPTVQQIRRRNPIRNSDQPGRSGTDATRPTTSDA